VEIHDNHIVFLIILIIIWFIVRLALFPLTLFLAFQFIVFWFGF